MLRPLSVSISTGFTLLALAPSAVAAPEPERGQQPSPHEGRFALHAEGGATHLVGADQDRFGWGGAGFASGELRFVRQAGIEVTAGGVLLAKGEQTEAYAHTGAGSAVLVFGGVRLGPLRAADVGIARGLWLAGGAGMAQTGELTRGALAVRFGIDLDLGPIAAGPFAGLVQVVQPDDQLRPEDGRLVLAGLHGVAAFGAARPESDRDLDGIWDSKDGCPDIAERADGFEDQDGCPDVDDDRDGVPDRDDRCRLEPEDRDGFEDTDGCPDLDHDHDGVPDSTDGCPTEAEDPDGFRDADGCPDVDDDEDGSPDAKDSCPNEPETANGYADDDGCPDDESVRVLGDRILLDERVHFWVNGTEVGISSYPLLARVAKLLRAQPSYALVFVEGHADDAGEEDYNLRLSEQRAKSVVELLVELGVPRERLTHEAWGETRPREQARTAQARRENRRVEFQILRRAAANGDAP